MQTRRLVGLGLSLVVLSVGMGGCGGLDDDADEETGATESPIGATAKAQIQYVVTAHPDDEFAAWSLVERSPHNYPVFILLTQGEETNYCTPGAQSANQTALGEARPAGSPYQGKWTASCKAARVGSWHRFLDAMSTVDPSLSRPGYRGSFVGSGLAGVDPPRRLDDGRPVESRSFRVWADARSARVAFDLGDGDLSPDEVTWAIQTVRGRRGQLFPLTKEYGVIAASYRNVDPRCDVYDHGDHRAVHQAIFDTDQGTPGPQWGRTCIHDPDVARGRVNEVDEDVFQFAMGVGASAIDPSRYPDARRTGAFQVHYGWLAGEYWPAEGREGEAHMGRKQAFWARH